SSVSGKAYRIGAMTVARPSHESLDVAPSNKHHVILFQSAAKFGTGDGIEFALSPGSSPFEMAHHDGCVRITSFGSIARLRICKKTHENGSWAALVRRLIHLKSIGGSSDQVNVSSRADYGFFTFSYRPALRP